MTPEQKIWFYLKLHQYKQDCLASFNDDESILAISESYTRLKITAYIAFELGILSLDVGEDINTVLTNLSKYLHERAIKEGINKYGDKIKAESN